MDEKGLIYRKDRDFLWVSSETKRIYLNEQENCLVLYFIVHKEMLSYIDKMLSKGYRIV